MALVPPQIGVSYYSSSVSPWANINVPITGVSYNLGRANFTDQYSGGSCTVYGKNPADIPYPPEIGQKVFVGYGGAPGSGLGCFYGYVQNWRVIYGIKPAYDTWELTIETGLGYGGRKTGTVTTVAGASTSDMADSIKTQIGTTAFTNGGGWGSTTSAQTLTGQIANPMNLLMQTEQGAWWETGFYNGAVYPPVFSPMLYAYGRNATQLYQNTGTFTDTGSALDQYRYQEIEFLSAAYNYGSKVTVQASGFSDQSSGTGDYTQTFTTINGSSSEAANLAGYIKSELDLATAIPYSITFTLANQSGYANDAFGVLCLPPVIKSLITVNFRGNTYSAVIEGISVNITPSGWLCTYTLSSNLNNAWLRLNNATLGRLDYNRLGF